MRPPFRDVRLDSPQPNGHAHGSAAAADGSCNGLTARETEVVRMIAEGLSTKEIAFQMGVAFKTAVAHRANAMRKIGCHDIATVTRHAIKTGLVQL